MQTNFRGRDLIGDLDFTKEEVETVLDVALDLKRKRALGEPHRLPARQGAGDAVLLRSPPAPAARSKRAWPSSADMALSSKATPPRSRTAIRRWKSVRSSVAISTALPSVTVTLAMGNKYLNDVAKYSPRPGPEHAVRHLPSLPVPGRPDDHHGEEGPRPAQEEDGCFVGVCRFLPQADLGAAIAHPADAALWHGCDAGLSARVQADARDHGAGQGAGRKFRHRLRDHRQQGWHGPKPARMRMSSTPNPGVHVDHTNDARRRQEDHQEVLQALDHG